MYNVETLTAGIEKGHKDCGLLESDYRFGWPDKHRAIRQTGVHCRMAATPYPAYMNV
jgi:hypothetical protein